VAVLQTREQRAGTDSQVALTRAERVVARALPSIADGVFVSVLLGVLFGLQGRALGYDGDAAWNLRIGLQILQHGIPHTEFMLSTTYGQPTIYWEWLAQVAYAVALQFGGLNGVVALAAGLVAVTSALLFAVLRQRDIPLLLAMPLALAGIGLTSITWTARAQLFSLLLTLLWSECIWRYWRSGNTRLLWFFPIAMVVWVNLHAGFISGFILLGTTVAVAWLFPAGCGKANPRHLSFALLSSLAATLVTPWGPVLWAHVYMFFRNPLITRYTQEYQSPDFHMLSGQVFLALVLLLVAAWLWLSRRSGAGETVTGAGVAAMEPLAFAHGAVWTVLALYSVRFIPLWALIVTPILGEALTSCARARLGASIAEGNVTRRLRAAAAGLMERAQRLESVDRQVGKGYWSILAVLFVALTVARGGVLPGTSVPALTARFDPQTFPVAAAQRLHQEGLPAGRGFTTFSWGGYLDYALPEYHAFIDSRSDVYSQQFLQDYADIISVTPRWQLLLDHYDVRWALLPVSEPLAQVLTVTPRWHCAPEDTAGVAVLCRRQPST
jgi:hypothetical protein